MLRQFGSTWRTWVACAAIVSLLLVTVALASGIHEHGASHCCDCCHFGHLTWLHSGDAPRIDPPRLREWRLHFDDARRSAEQDCAARSSRAPPTC
jgi:hypothetical protein